MRSEGRWIVGDLAEREGAQVAQALGVPGCGRGERIARGTHPLGGCEGEVADAVGHGGQ